MFRVTKYIEIDMGHRVPYHASKCARLHGHRYRILVEAAAMETHNPHAEDPESGMVVDFGILKQVLMEEIHDRYDHRLVLWEDDSIVDILEEAGVDFVCVPCIPTAEELAELWYYAVENGVQRAAGRTIAVLGLTVYETPTSTASFTPADAFTRLSL